jgi:hypothetical protein
MFIIGYGLLTAVDIIFWRAFMKKGIICTIILFTCVKIYSQEVPLILNMNIGEEIWLDGNIIIFNGLPPNIRMTIFDNNIIGIDEEDVPEVITRNIGKYFIRGTFKLKLTHLTDIPYYENKLMVFKIIDYKDINLIEK